MSETTAGGTEGEEKQTTFVPEPKKHCSLEAVFQENSMGLSWAVGAWVPKRVSLGPQQCLCTQPLPSALEVPQPATTAPAPAPHLMPTPWASLLRKVPACPAESG